MSLSEFLNYMCSLSKRNYLYYLEINFKCINFYKEKFVYNIIFHK